jgi:hypothetical protein
MGFLFTLFGTAFGIGFGIKFLFSPSTVIIGVLFIVIGVACLLLCPAFLGYPIPFNKLFAKIKRK